MLLQSLSRGLLLLFRILASSITDAMYDNPLTLLYHRLLVLGPAAEQRLFTASLIADAADAAISLSASQLATLHATLSDQNASCRVGAIL